MPNMLYLETVRVGDGKSLRGGALVVDEATEPLEFRCTSVVKPSALQSILWGARLDAHIMAAMLGKPLIQQTKSEFGLVLVTERNFLELRESLHVPVVLLRRDSDIEFEDDRSEDKTAKGARDATQSAENTEAGATSSVVLSHGLGRFEPIVLECDPAHKEDREIARGILRAVFERRDVLEPFERIRTAINTLHEEEAKKAGH